VTHSEFLIAVDDEFGMIQARTIVRELVLDNLGHSTAAEALARGVSPRDVWLALCGAMEVPRERWYGAGVPQPPRDTPA
jgi:hypothetical protein